MADRIIIRNTGQEANLENIQATDVLNGELLLVREADKERLYCKNSVGGITPIHRITDAGDFTVELNVIEVQKADIIAGDVCAWDGNSKRFFRFVDSGATDDIKKYTPIGVVVIPSSHDVYGTGECGVMSLKAMNCDTPSIGGIVEQGMNWGVYGTNISGLPDLKQLPNGNTSNGIPTSSSTYGYLPSDKFSDTQCAHDTDAYYSVSPYAPSPYLTDGSRNPGYYQTTSPSSSNNALADFDGKGNTQKIITQRGTKDYDSWKPNKETSADYPAASCCDMFYTEGTQQGDWYLPAMGELGYIMPPLGKINNAINKIRITHGSSVGVELGIINSTYWSSTEYSNNLARSVDTNNYYGTIGSPDKDFKCYARAYLRVGTT